METKRLPHTSFKAMNDDAGTFEGYLAVFGNLDLNGDVIDKGAFTRTLGVAKAVQKQNKSQFLYPLLWQHNTDEPIGGISDAYEDTYGLYIKGQYDLNTELGARAYSGVKMGYLPGLSIGFRTIKSTRDTKGQHHLTELQLFEGSVVTLPANPSAMVTSVKNRGMRQAYSSGSEEHLMDLEWKTAVWALEAKAAKILHDHPEIIKNRERTDEIDKAVARIKASIATLSTLSDSGEYVAKLRATLDQLAAERDELNPFQARMKVQNRAVQERTALEREARARGEQVPSVYGDPEAYVAWLQRQRQLPYVELAKELDREHRQSRQSR